MKHVLALSAVLLVGGCIERANQVIDRTAVLRTNADALTAASAQALKDQCLLLQTGIAVASLFANKPRVVNAWSRAQIVATSFCTGPTPQDIPNALLAIATAYRAVVNSDPEVKAQLYDNNL